MSGRPRAVEFELPCLLSFVLPCVLLFAGCAREAGAGRVRGVDEHRIVVGAHVPLDGPVAVHGIPWRNGMLLRVEELAAAGGVHGRIVDLRVENNAYDPGRAVLAAEKLLSQDEVFAMVGALGTPTNRAALTRILEQRVPNLFPGSFSRAMYEPLHPLKFAHLTPYYHQIRAAVRSFVDERGCRRVGVLYQDDEFGQDVRDGARDELEARSTKLVVETRYRRGDREFRAQLAKLAAADLDLVVLGTVVTETVAVCREARRIGLRALLCGSSAAYSREIEVLDAGSCEGLFVTTHTPLPPADPPPGELANWVARYRQRFGAEPDLGSLNGYVAMDLFVLAAERAGPELDAKALCRAIETIEGYQDPFGGPTLSFSPTRHLGADPVHGVLLCTLKGGRWRTLGPIE